MIVERLSVDSRETAGSCPQKRVNDSFFIFLFYSLYYVLCKRVEKHGCVNSRKTAGSYPEVGNVSL